MNNQQFATAEAISALIDDLYEARAINAELVAALEKLTAEAIGFVSMADRNAHGNTNINVMNLRIDVARAVLAKVKP